MRKNTCMGIWKMGSCLFFLTLMVLVIVSGPEPYKKEAECYDKNNNVIVGQICIDEYTEGEIAMNRAAIASIPGAIAFLLFLHSVREFLE